MRSPGSSIGAVYPDGAHHPTCKSISQHVKSHKTITQGADQSEKIAAGNYWLTAAQAGKEVGTQQ